MVIMAKVTPFRALRPEPDLAPRVSSVPYDVVSTAEARALAGDDPLSFLRVTRSEIELPPGSDAYSPEVYARARDELRAPQAARRRSRSRPSRRSTSIG